MQHGTRAIHARHSIARALCGAVRSWQIYVLLLPALVYFTVFCYLPMYGVQIAFRDYKVTLGITGSPWVGLKHLRKFFGSYYCGRMFRNTVVLNACVLLFGFPAPILLALLLRQIAGKRARSFAQTAVVLPHFISTVVVAGIVTMFLSPSHGLLNALLTAAVPGRRAVDYLMEPRWFRTIYVGTEVWQNAGWNALLYVAALGAIPPELYEAASIDGASRWQSLVHIDLPHLLPVSMIVLILGFGALLSSNVDKTLLLQTSGNIPVSDILGIYVYSVGLAASRAQYSYASAIGLCLNVMNFAALLSVNAVSRRLNASHLL